MEGCYTAGADPELMLVDANNKLVSAIDINLPGTKEKPKKVTKGAVQRDNVMAEFNVNPANTSEEFEDNIRSVLKSLHKLVNPNRLVIRASADFPKKALDNDEARIFGCDPDFNAWTLDMNAVDGLAAESPFRSAGGHFHVGKKRRSADLLDDPYGKIEVVKMMDIFMGVPSVLIDPDPTSPARRKLYGGAGAHRPKDYGVEYRALGNFWVGSPKTVRLMYDLADLAVEMVLENQSEAISKLAGQDRVIETINKSNTRKACNIIKAVSKYIPDHLKDQLNEIPSTDLYENWGL